MVQQVRVCTCICDSTQYTCSAGNVDETAMAVAHAFEIPVASPSCASKLSTNLRAFCYADEGVCLDAEWFHNPPLLSIGVMLRGQPGSSTPLG
eukprot:4176542-Amphidinium_carterae.1